MKQKRNLLLLAALLAAVLASAAVGRYGLTICDLWKICTGTMEHPMKADVFLKIRLPRILFAGLTGAALSVSGMVYQELFQNPLVSPDVMGVSGGACVGAVAAILCGAGGLWIQGAAFLAGMAAVLLTVCLANLMGHGNRVHLLLSGIVVKAAADSALMALKYAADPMGQLALMDYWLMGSFHKIRWADVKAAAGPVLVLLLGLWGLRFRLAVLSLGDEDARSLGLSVQVVKWTAVFGATALAAATVSVTGVVTWVGLIVPHMVRFFTGGSLTKYFGTCAVSGAVFMIVTDTLARSVTSAEIPISILTSAFGAVFLLAVLMRREYRKEGAR